MNQPKKRRRRLTLRDELEMANGCLQMVHEILEHRLGGGGIMDHTPAMMYPEAIHTAIRRHVLIALYAAEIVIEEQFGQKGFSDTLRERYLALVAERQAPDAGTETPKQGDAK